LRRFRVILAILVLAATAILVSQFGPQPAAGPRRTRLWVVSDLAIVRPDDAPLSSSAVWDGQTITLAAGRNEVVAWQVVLRPARAVTDGKVSVEPLDSGQAQLPANCLQIFREHFLNVTVPSQETADKPAKGQLGRGEFPNQLLPLIPGDAKHGTFEAAPGRAAPLWFDLTVPEGAAPGVYRSTIHLTAGGLALSLPLTLTVHPFTLPRATHWRNWFYYGPEQLAEFYGEAEAKLVEPEFRRLAHDHRLTLLPDLLPPAEPEARAGWWREWGPWLDGAAFDSGPCRGAGATCFPVGVPEPKEPAVKALARAAVEVAEAHELADKALVWVADEPNSAEAYDQIRRVGGWIKQAVGKRLPVMVTEQIGRDKPEWGSLEDVVDIFCSSKTTTVAMRRWHERGGWIWVYNGGLAGPALLDCPLTGVAAWGPCAWRFGLDGWFQWDTLYWRQKHVGATRATDLYADPLTFDETLKRDADGKPYPAAYAIRFNGDGVLFYPGEPVGYHGPIASLRVKAIRRGAQDYEYLWLLAQAGQRARAEAAARQLSTGRYQYETDPDAWVQRRAELAAALAGGQ
jgi:hypothetical protein